MRIGQVDGPSDPAKLAVWEVPFECCRPTKPQIPPTQILVACLSPDEVEKITPADICESLEEEFPGDGEKGPHDK
jgi:hypothetical protein